MSKAMKSENRTLVPRLRFPEFLKSGEWEERLLGTQGDFLSSLSGKTAKDFDVGNAKFIPYMNVFSNTFSDVRDLRAVDVTEGESQNAVAEGDVFFTVSSETPEEAGMSSVLLEAIDNCYLNSFCAMFRFYNKRSPNPVFLGYWLRSGLVRAHLSRGAQGATRYNISKPVFREVPLLLPPPLEQQKIADCLWSLDALIAAQTDKIDALKTHKKGLMQQLFPREGESVPRLRFPEFRGAGEWRYKKAGLLFANRIEQGQDGLPIYSVTMNDGVAKRDSLDRKIDNISESSGNKKAHKHDIIYNMMRMWQGASGVAFEDCMVSPAYVVLAPRDSISSAFFGYLFKTHQFLHILTAHSQGLTKDRLRLYFKDFAQIPLPSPPVEEQRKIADCLSSIDVLISGQMKKLDALKAQKKGLMQQLFPSLASGVKSSG